MTTPITNAQRGVRAGYPWQRSLRTTVRVLSTLAAMVGIVFLLSGILAGLPTQGGSSPRATNSSAAPPGKNGPVAATKAAQQAAVEGGSQPVSPDATVPAIAPTLNVMATSPTPKDQPVPSPTQEHFDNHVDNAGSGPTDTPPFLDLSTAGARTWLGTILLILSIGGLIFLRRRTPHQQ